MAHEFLRGMWQMIARLWTLFGLGGDGQGGLPTALIEMDAWLADLDLHGYGFMGRRDF